MNNTAVWQGYFCFVVGGIDIIYDSEILKNCTVTADIRNESFYRQLDLICDAVGAKYELMDGQVVIQSKGCQ